MAGCSMNTSGGNFHFFHGVFLKMNAPAFGSSRPLIQKYPLGHLVSAVFLSVFKQLSLISLHALYCLCIGSLDCLCLIRLCNGIGSGKAQQLWRSDARIW